MSGFKPASDMACRVGVCGGGSLGVTRWHSRASGKKAASPCQICPHIGYMALNLKPLPPLAAATMPAVKTC